MRHNCCFSLGMPCLEPTVALMQVVKLLQLLALCTSLCTCHQLYVNHGSDNINIISVIINGLAFSLWAYLCLCRGSCCCQARSLDLSQEGFRMELFLSFFQLCSVQFVTGPSFTFPLIKPQMNHLSFECAVILACIFSTFHSSPHHSQILSNISLLDLMVFTLLVYIKSLKLPFSFYFSCIVLFTRFFHNMEY